MCRRAGQQPKMKLQNVSIVSAFPRVSLCSLVHFGFSEGADFDEQFSRVQSGWEMALASLRAYLDGHYGRPRSQFMVLKSVEAEAWRRTPISWSRSVWAAGSALE
jgi:hypothetical protein